MVKLNNIKFNGLTYRDQVIYIFIQQFPNKTTKELSVISACNYYKITISIKNLLEKDLILKSMEYPPRYEIKDG